MLQVAIVSSDPRTEELLKPSGLTTARFPRESWSPSSLDSAPAALLVDVRGLPQLPATLTLARRDYPTTPIVLITSSLDGQLMLEAMRAGVSECVPEPLTSQALDAALRRVIKDAGATACQVFAFVGAKGGVGTTTLAVNTAATLARGRKGEVLFIDLHASHGDAAVFVGVEPRFSVIDALENSHRLDDALFRSLIEQTKWGIDLLASVRRVGSRCAGSRDVAGGGGQPGNRRTQERCSYEPYVRTAVRVGPDQVCGEPLLPPSRHRRIGSREGRWRERTDGLRR